MREHHPLNTVIRTKSPRSRPVLCLRSYLTCGNYDCTQRPASCNPDVPSQIPLFLPFSQLRPRQELAPQAVRFQIVERQPQLPIHVIRLCKNDVIVLTVGRNIRTAMNHEIMCAARPASAPNVTHTSQYDG